MDTHQVMSPNHVHTQRVKHVATALDLRKSKFSSFEYFINIVLGDE